MPIDDSDLPLVVRRFMDEEMNSYVIDQWVKGLIDSLNVINSSTLSNRDIGKLRQSITGEKCDGAKYRVLQELHQMGRLL